LWLLPDHGVGRLAERRLVPQCTIRNLGLSAAAIRPAGSQATRTEVEAFVCQERELGVVSRIMRDRGSFRGRGKHRTQGEPMKHYGRVITFGTFDLLHEGHLRIIERAKALGDYLVVGVSSDRLNLLKGKKSILPEHQRLAYIQALRWVDDAFLEDSLELKDEYIKTYAADVLVMGDDWAGKFDWVSCDTVYLTRTEGVSSTSIKKTIELRYRPFKVLFYDSYIQKHYDCALPLVSVLADLRVTCIIPREEFVGSDHDCDCLIFFNTPRHEPNAAYQGKPFVLIDHGASNLKWFVSDLERVNSFDRIITAGPEHVRSIEAFFSRNDKVVSGGFVKSSELLAPSENSRDEICHKHRLDPVQKIILFVPTWHKSDHPDLKRVTNTLRTVENHVVVYHQETEFFGAQGLNVSKNEPGVVTELMKHADVIISDYSSTLFEAAALKKPAIQILLREYPDNPSVMYDFPVTAGTSELFCGGIPTRPAGLLETLAGLDRCESNLATLQTRILEGTIISESSSEVVAQEVANACAAGAVRDRRKNVAHRSERWRRTLWLNTNRIISHAGGQVDGMDCTNSLEALQQNTGNAVKFIELDVVSGSDGVLIAHDACEKDYGLDRNFSNVGTAEFRSLLFKNILHTVDLQTAIEFAANIDAVLVFDVKAVGHEYQRVVRDIVSVTRELDASNHIAVQAYCLNDFEFCNGLSVRMIMPAVRNYHFRDPLGIDAFEFCNYCFRVNRDAMIGLSLPFASHHKTVIEDDRRFAFFRFWKRIYVHGAPYEAYSAVLSHNMGLFADGVSPSVPFSHIPKDFSWVDYAFINSDKIDISSATLIDILTHFVEFGQTQNLRRTYNPISGEDPDDFLHRRRDLRALGISGPNSLRGYLTRAG